MIETDACEDVTAADAQRQTKQNHYFDASEHGPGAAKVARGQRSGSERPDLGQFIFGLSERNKIKILLRSRG